MQGQNQPVTSLKAQGVEWMAICRDLVRVIESELTPAAQAACPELVYARGFIRNKATV